MGYRGRFGLIAAAMVIGADGCVTAPAPLAESVVASTQSSPARVSAKSGGGADGVAEDAADGAAGAGGRADGAAGAGAGAGGGADGAPGSAPTQTSDERRAALDKQLNDSLGAFDARLRGEQQKIAEERDARQATVGAAAGAGATASAASAGDAEGTATGEGQSPSPGERGRKRDSRTAHAGDLKSDQAQGVGAVAGGNGARATVIPDGNDDDIVARRLRKAAELETDPELKDKLWKEYVEYKKNT